MKINNKIALTIVMSIPVVGNVLAGNNTSMVQNAINIPQEIVGHWYSPCNPDSGSRPRDVSVKLHLPNILSAANRLNIRLKM